MARAKQIPIKGMEPVVDEEIERVADEYDAEREALVVKRQIVAELEEKLVDTLTAKKLTFYCVGKYNVKMKSKNSVKVKIGAEEQEEE
jgi:hypothetical protein